MNKQLDGFTHVLNKGISSLEKSLKSKLEKIFTDEMLKMKWKDFKAFKKQISSKYMKSTKKLLCVEHFLPLKKFIKEFYFDMYFNRILVLINKIFIYNLYTCKAITIEGVN